MNFFDKHGVWTLIFLAIFPRLTLLFGAFASGGVFLVARMAVCATPARRNPRASILERESVSGSDGLDCGVRRN